MPMLMIAPPDLAQANNGEAWFGISNSSPVYGGCIVHLSYDNTNYKVIATHRNNAVQGILTAAFAADATSLSVNVSMSNGIIENVTALEKDSGGSLCRVGNELLSYQDVTLTGAHQYTLTGLKRGLYGTVKGAANGALFTVCDIRLLKLPIDKSWNGNTMFFKFQAFNCFGRAIQDLSSVPVYQLLIDSETNGTLVKLTDFNSQFNNQLSNLADCIEELQGCDCIPFMFWSN